MPQYLNPYEGVGNALIDIGRSYDAERRAKREAIEDQKRRRADYKWQSKLEEEKDLRKFEREKPLEELRLRKEVLVATAAAARASAEETRAKMGTISNLPGAGGSIRRYMDDSGNLVEETIPYKPLPQRPEQTKIVEAVDDKGNLVIVDQRGNQIPTNLKPKPTSRSGATSGGMTDKEKREIEDKRFKAMLDLEKEFPLPKIPGTEDPYAEAREAKRQWLNAHYDQQLGIEPPPPPKGLLARGAERVAGIGSAIGGGVSKIGNALLRSEEDVFADMESGRITPQQAAQELADRGGAPVSLGEGGVTASPKAKKTASIKDTPAFKQEKAKLLKQHPDATEKEIEDYLLETWGK